MEKQTECTKEIKKILKEFCYIELNEEDVTEVICMGSTLEQKRPVQIHVNR